MPKSQSPQALRLGFLALAGLTLAACNQEPVPAVAPPSEPSISAPSDSAASADWSKLQSLTGQLPSESGLFATSAIAAPLQTLLGDRFEAFKANFQVETPLQAADAVLYTSGNKPSEGGTEQAYILINPEDHGLEVGLWEKGKLTTYKTQGKAIAKPADIQTMINNASS